MSKLSKAAGLLRWSKKRKARSQAASIMGLIGGRVKSPAKTAAARQRALDGVITGRPRLLYPPCTKDPPYPNKQHRFSKKTNRCYGCGYQR